MRVIPKKTKYHFAFRNKIQTNKIKKCEHRVLGGLRAFDKKTTFDNLLKIKAWIPPFPCFHKDVAMVKTTQKHNYFNHAYVTQLLFGDYGIAFKNHGKLSAKFIETIRLDIAKTLKKKSKAWLRVCCDTPVTSRPAETRMGKGKGAISYWEANVSPGQVFFEFSGISSQRAEGILKSLQRKSPISLTLLVGR